MVKINPLFMEICSNEVYNNMLGDLASEQYHRYPEGTYGVLLRKRICYSSTREG